MLFLFLIIEWNIELGIFYLATALLDFSIIRASISSNIKAGTLSISSIKDFITSYTSIISSSDPTFINVFSTSLMIVHIKNFKPLNPFLLNSLYSSKIILQLNITFFISKSYNS